VRRKAVRRKTKRRYKRNPPSRAARRRGGKKAARGVKAMRRSRRSIKAARRRGGLSLAYARRFRMRTNPTGGIVDALKMALPIGVSFYGSRFIINQLGDKVPMIDRLGTFKKPALAGLMVVAAHYGTTKITALKKHRHGIMIGTSLNLIDNLLAHFAPASVKAMFGVGDAGIYGGMGEYVQVGEYVTVDGAPPIDDDIALSDYVEIGDVEEELGMLQEELGVEEDLGMLQEELGVEEDLGAGYDDRMLGGVHQGSMLAPIRKKQMVAPVPTRSFTKPVPKAGAGFDKPSVLYTGIFGGGFGN
jgi:hypothetical protein